jgi:hypothetical protein
MLERGDGACYDRSMSRVPMLASLLLTPLAALATLATVPSCETDQLKGPQAEVKAHNVKLDLPALPGFEMPATNADGTHSVKELRVKGKKMLNTELSVKGYVTWVYDCPTALRQPGWSDKQIADYIEESPDKCERPKFYLGDAPDTPPERSLWVVEVPRPPNKLEKKRLPRDELRFWPAVPPYKQGDEIVVTGEFRLASPHSERNTDGLLVYKSLKNATQGWESPPLDPKDPRNAAPTRQPPAGTL